MPNFFTEMTLVFAKSMVCCWVLGLYTHISKTKQHLVKTKGFPGSHTVKSNTEKCRDPVFKLCSFLALFTVTNALHISLDPACFLHFPSGIKRDTNHSFLVLSLNFQQLCNICFTLTNLYIYILYVPSIWNLINLKFTVKCWR